MISKDQWHTNENIIEAEKLVLENNIPTKTSDLNESDFSLVPIGRAEYSGGFYSMFGTYCSNPEHHYSFLIDYFRIFQHYSFVYFVHDYNMN